MDRDCRLQAELQPGLRFVNLASTAFSALARETG
jgi:hypothetical protein